MTIQEEGFLAKEIDIYVERYKATHVEVLSLAHDLNKLGQRVLRRDSVVGQALSDVEPLMFLLLVRTLSNFQCAILLAERGALVESRTLSRSCLETVFCVGALARGGEDFIKQLSGALIRERKSTANWILQKPAVREAMGAPHIDTLQRYVEGITGRLDELKGLGIEEMARQGKLEQLYLWYRQLSGDAAHPTLDALERYLVRDNDGGVAAVQWGPSCDSDELHQTVLMSCNWLFVGLFAAEDKFQFGVDRETLAELWKRFKALSDG